MLLVEHNFAPYNLMPAFTDTAEDQSSGRKGRCDVG